MTLVQQARRGDYYEPDCNAYEMLLRREIDAQLYLLQNADRFKIPANETRETKKALESYMAKLDSLLGR